MKKLYLETLARFPEVELLADSEDDSAYAHFAYIIGWIENLPSSAITESLIDRVASFAEWCCEQPEVDDETHHPSTILMLGLFESLPSSENGRKIMAKIWDKDYLLENESYLRQWVGEAEYEALIAEY